MERFMRKKHHILKNLATKQKLLSRAKPAKMKYDNTAS